VSGGKKHKFSFFFLFYSVNILIVGWEVLL
jgi:hypothetical protein